MLAQALAQLVHDDAPHLPLLALDRAGRVDHVKTNWQLGLFILTGINAMVFSDIDEADSSQATAINAVAQQTSLAMGVAVAGAILDVAGQFHSGGIGLNDFHIAFFIVAAVSAVASLTFMRLAPDAGAAVSGHGRLVAPKTLETAGTAGK